MMRVSNSFVRLVSYFLTLVLVMFFIKGCGTESDTGTGKLFKSSNIASGETFSFTFMEEGTVEYYCGIHGADMQGVVTVNGGAEISGRDTVEMVNIQFSPAQITVVPNTEIVWINRDDFSHTVVSGNPQTYNGGGY